MEIFEIRGGHCFPTIECLTTEPFKRVWEQDTSPEKGNAEKVFRYVNFMCKPVKSNYFYGIKDEEERSKAVKKEVWGTEEAPTTIDMVQCCMKFVECMKMYYKAHYDALESATGLVDKLTYFYKSVNLNERTSSGAVIHKPKDIQSSLKELGDTLKKMDEYKAKMHEAVTVGTKTTNNREPNLYEE